MSQLSRIKRLYDRDPVAYDRSMSSGLTARMLAGREKVGENVRGRLLDIGFGTGLSLPHYPASVDVIGLAFNLCLCTIPDPERAIPEAVRVAPTGCSDGVPRARPVALLQEMVNPACVILAADHFNRRTAEIARRAGVEVEEVDRWMLGVFNLIVGRVPDDRP